MLTVERRERIVAELRRRGAARVTELAEILQVSLVTVRRDITALEREKRVARVHGGVMLPAERPRVPEPADRLTLGMVVPTLDFFWPQVITGARTAAAMLGVDLRLRGSSYDTVEDRRQIARLLADEPVDGLLVAPDLHDDLRAIAALPVPCILMERAAPVLGPAQRPLESVRNDHDAGTEIAVRHLLDQGHRRVGVVVTPLSPNADLVERGFTRACHVLGVDGSLVVRESLRADPVAAAGVLDACHETGTTALLVHSDLDAIAVARAAAGRGLGVPAELALIAYDDEQAHRGDPPLTAVRPVKGQIGRMAVEMLVSRLQEGSRRPANRLLLVPELVVRQSSLARRH